MSESWTYEHLVGAEAMLGGATGDVGSGGWYLACISCAARFNSSPEPMPCAAGRLAGRLPADLLDSALAVPALSEPGLDSPPVADLLDSPLAESGVDNSDSLSLPFCDWDVSNILGRRRRVRRL